MCGYEVLSIWHNIILKKEKEILEKNIQDEH